MIMTCGFEHISNCHNEWTFLFMGLSIGLVWIKLQWHRLKTFVFLLWNKLKKN